ncbi:hypothetical protein ACF09H_22045 [Streptomyces sp. NPDC014983]|uniref:hypothetical protein n=1 Tax=Streptomyces sp. NPDC014983 TaxID=3364933 RepID=UPI0036F643AA
MSMHSQLIESRTAVDLEGYGVLDMVSTTRPGDPSVLYRLHGPHVRGCLLLTPASAEDDPTAPRARSSSVIFDPAPRLPFGQTAVRPITVNSIPLFGPWLLNTDDPSSVRPHRPGRTGRPEPMPVRTRERARAVIAAVLEHWRQRGDREDLDRAARHRAALLFLTRYRAQLEHRRLILERARIAVAETAQRIALLQDALNGTDQPSSPTLEYHP